MIIYLLKTIACSGLLWGVYKLFLEKENMNHFKRFYLLFSLVFSYTMPLLVFTVQQVTDPVMATVNTFTPAVLPETVTGSHKTQLPEFYSYTSILLYVYGAITLLFLVRLTAVLWLLSEKIRRNKTIQLDNVTLVLIEQNIQPYSFLHYIFVSASAYNANRIEQAILDHEMTHVRQKHSFDIIAVELLRTICWFNPFVYAYKRAIQLNHEFLADGHVVKTCNDIPSYQYLLLNTIRIQSKAFLTSPFNFLTAKKRLIMMTKQTSRLTAVLRMIVITLIVIISGYAFSTKAIAQQKEKPQPQVQPEKQTVTGTGGVSEEELNEFKNIVEKYHNVKNSNAVYDFRDMTQAERERLKTIYFNMTAEQQSSQFIRFKPPVKPLPKTIPTERQFESFKNPEIYGVWVNGRKTKNTDLDRYRNTDFAQVFVSKLYGAAKRNVNYSYQVNLMTKDYYRNYYNAAIADTSYSMVIMARAYKQ
ncbi:MAG: M56 family metallopeptidase [Agriterribacter sp.]